MSPVHGWSLAHLNISRKWEYKIHSPRWAVLSLVEVKWGSLSRESRVKSLSLSSRELCTWSIVLFRVPEMFFLISEKIRVARYFGYGISIPPMYRSQNRWGWRSIQPDTFDSISYATGTWMPLPLPCNNSNHLPWPWGIVISFYLYFLSTLTNKISHLYQIRLKLTPLMENVSVF